MTKLKLFPYICTTDFLILILFFFNNNSCEAQFLTFLHKHCRISSPILAKSVISSHNNIFCMQLVNKNPAYKIFRLHMHEIICKRIFNLDVNAKFLTQYTSFIACRYEMLVSLWTYRKWNTVKCKQNC